jgi:hypothetical protein
MARVETLRLMMISMWQVAQTVIAYMTGKWVSHCREPRQCRSLTKRESAHLGYTKKTDGWQRLDMKGRWRDD